MKIRWNNLEEEKCPTPGCKTKGRKTALEEVGFMHYRCPKCEGEWAYVVYGPLDSCWRQEKEPVR